MHMIKNPFVSALLASLYIAAVASFFYYAQKILGQSEDTVVAPIAVLLLFVLSAAVMGFLFLYSPLRLFFEGERERAVAHFLSTVAIFAGITAAILALLFSGVLS